MSIVLVGRAPGRTTRRARVVASCPCAGRVASIMRAVGMTVLFPRTPEEWLAHIIQEDDRLYPLLLDVSGYDPEVVAAVRAWVSEHGLYRSLLAEGKDLPSGHAEHSVDVHGREEDVLVDRYGDALRMAAVATSARTTLDALSSSARVSGPYDSLGAAVSPASPADSLGAAVSPAPPPGLLLTPPDPKKEEIDASRARAAAVLTDACSLLDEDPDGLRGPPHSSWSASVMSDVSSFRPFSPRCVRWVAITTLTYFGPSSDAVLAFHGYDATGQWWHGQADIVGGRLYKSDDPSVDDRSWFQKAVDAVGSAIVDYGVPALAAALAVASPGIGLAAGGALLTWRNLAHGESLSDAVIDAQRTSFSKSPTALDAFEAGRKLVQSGAAESAILSYVQEHVADAENRKVFLGAAQLVRAQQTQDLLVEALASYLGPDDGNTMRTAIRWGAQVKDAIFGLRGVEGQKVMESLSAQAAKIVDDHREDPAYVTKLASDPLAVRDAFTFSTQAPGSSGGGVGTTLLTVAALGALAYGVWRWVF